MVGMIFPGSASLQGARLLVQCETLATGESGWTLELGHQQSRVFCLLTALASEGTGSSNEKGNIRSTRKLEYA